MGSRERQDREKQAVRQAILDAARDLFTIEGYRNVSIRKIAERIEYSPAAIYSYFASKDDIYLALAEDGFRRLDAKLKHRQPPGHAPPAGPGARMVGVLRVFQGAAGLLRVAVRRSIGPADHRRLGGL